MTNYTPTTEQVRELWRNQFYEGIADKQAKTDAGWNDDLMYAQFDRWFAGVRKVERDAAFREAALRARAYKCPHSDRIAEIIEEVAEMWGASDE